MTHTDTPDKEQHMPKDIREQQVANLFERIKLVGEMLAATGGMGNAEDQAEHREHWEGQEQEALAELLSLCGAQERGADHIRPMVKGWTYHASAKGHITFAEYEQAHDLFGGLNSYEKERIEQHFRAIDHVQHYEKVLLPNLPTVPYLADYEKYALHRTLPALVRSIKESEAI